MNLKKHAFTMIELLVVTLVVGVLAGVAVPRYNDFVTDSRRGSCLTNLKTIEQSIAVWETRNNRLFPSRRFLFRFQPIDGLIWESFPEGGSARRPSGRDLADIVGDSGAFACPELVKRYNMQANIPKAQETSYLWVQRAGENDAWTDRIDDFGAGEVRNAICPAFGRPGRSNEYVDQNSDYLNLPAADGVSDSQLVYRPFHGPAGTRESLHYDKKLASGTTWYVELAVANPAGIDAEPFLLFPKGVALTFAAMIEPEPSAGGANPKVTDILANGNAVLKDDARTWTPPDPGEYVLTARAQDDTGLIRFSSPIRIRIPKPPTVVVSTGANNPTNKAVPVSVVFNVPVNGFSLDKIETSDNAFAENFKPIANDQQWTFDLTPNNMGASCTLKTWIAEGAVEDAVGNLNALSNILEHEFQPIPPTLIVYDPDVSRTKAGPVKFDVGYFGASEITLTSAHIQIVSDPEHAISCDEPVISGHGLATRTVTLSGLTGDGTCAIRILASSAVDLAGNEAGPSAVSASFTVDNTKPVVEWVYEYVQADGITTRPTKESPLLVIASFSKPVRGLVPTEISVNPSGEFDIYDDFWPDGASTTFVLRFVPRPNELNPEKGKERGCQLYIAQGVCEDDVGNTNLAVDRTLLLKYDNVKPELTISTTASNPTNLSPIPFKLKFSEKVYGFDPNLIYANDSELPIQAVQDEAFYSWNIKVKPTISSGAIIVSAGEHVAKDEAGNTTDCSDFRIQYHAVHPVVQLSQLPDPVTWVRNIQVMVKDTDVKGEPISHYRYKLNELTWSNEIESTTPVTELITRTDLPEGTHILSVLGRTSYGIEQNIDMPTVWYWVIDATKPTIKTATVDKNPTKDSPIHVNVTFSEPVVILGSSSSELFCNDAVIQNFTGTGSAYAFDIVPNDKDSDNLFNVTFIEGMAKDFAGNPNLAHNQLKVYYDVTPPIATFTLTPSELTYDRLAMFRVGGPDVVGYRYKHVSPYGTTDWSAELDVAEPFVLNYLQVGLHTVYAIGCDAVGNWLSSSSPDVASFSWLVKPVYVTTIAGSGLAGTTDGKWYEAKFKDIRGVTALGDKILIADNGIRQLDLTTGVVSTPRPGIVRDGMILHLDASNATSYPGNGSVWYDLSDKGSHGALINGVGYDATTKSMVFDGVDDRVETVNHTYTADTTWEAWFQCTQSMNSYNMFMGRSLPYFGLYAGNQIIFSNTINGVQKTIYSPTNLSVGQWYHVVCTTEFNGADTKASIYIDGALVGTGNFPGAQSHSSSKFSIGDGRNSLWYPFKGKVSVVRIYDRTLSLAEIQHNLSAHSLGTLTYYDVITDGQGYIYATSYGSHIVRKITEEDLVATILAGKDGTAGFKDDTGEAARFRSPSGVVYYNGFLYVADRGNHLIRKVNTAGGIVSTFAGVGAAGSVDGDAVGQASFREPIGIGVDAVGNFYVADHGNHTIRKIGIDGRVTTIAGSPGQSGYADGLGSAARFSTPYGVAADSVGNVMVLDFGNKVIRKISPSGAVSTVAGAPGVSANADGLGGEARFKGGVFICCKDDDHFLVADRDSYTIKQVSFQPYVVLRSLPNVLTFQSGVNKPPISISVTGGGVTGYKYALNGGDPVERVLGTQITASGLNDGSHYIEVWGKGAASDWQENPTLFRWTVDTVPPRLVLSNLPPDGGRDTFVFIHVAAEPGDEADSYEYKLDGSEWKGLASISRPISIPDLQPGAHSIVVRGIDVAGNVQNVEANFSKYEWTIAPTYVNTVAGIGGSSGLADGRPYDTKFNYPMGTTQVGSDIYVCDRMNNLLRKIDLTNALVTTIDPGKFAIQFNGLNNYMSVPHASYFNSDSVTVELWFTLKGDLDTNANNNWRSLIRKGSTSSTKTGWDVVLEEARTVTWDVGVGGVTSRLFVNVGMKPNEPIHLAFVYDAATGKQSVFANGVIKGTQTITPGAIGANSEPIIVAGGTNTGNFPSGSGYTPGKYCNIRIWDIARTDADILAYYRGGLPARPDNLVGSYKCSDGSGSNVSDDSIKSGAGTLVNSPTWTTTDISVPLLSQPHDVTVYDSQDGQGPMLYVADFYNSVVRKVDPRTLETTVLAGRLGAAGTVNDDGEAARFCYPVGIVAHDGNLYVSDWGHHTIRKIHITSRSVSTFAGAAAAGDADGQGGAARFRNPGGLAIDTQAGLLYVADCGNHTIRCIDLQGANVSTFAGAAGVAGSNSSVAPSLARFNEPFGLAFDRTHTSLFVSEYVNHTIRLIDIPANMTMTIAGHPGSRGYGDNTGAAARFYGPRHLSPTGTGFNEGVFLGEVSNFTVRSITFLPMAVLKNVPPRLTNQQTISISVGGAGIKSSKYKLDDADWATLPGTTLVKANLEEGAHALQVIGQGVNNEWQLEGEATKLTWMIDTTPPVVVLSNRPTNPTYDLLADITVTGEAEPVLYYKYKLDNAANWTASISHVLPIELRNLAPGTHTLRVIGQDEAGNWQPDDQATTYEWLVKPVYITTVAGNGIAGLEDGKWYNARLNNPYDMVVLDDTLYFTEYANKCVRSMNLHTGEVKTVAGSPLGFSVLSFDGVDDFAQAPPGIYFSGNFTIMAWIYVRQFSSWSRVIDFGNGQNSDNVLLAITNDTTGKPNMHVFNGATNTNMTAPDPIPLNQWVHLAATLDGTIGRIYVNGVMVLSQNLTTPRNITRNRCYIGRSNWNNALANTFMSDLSIWNYAKSVADINAVKESRLIGDENGLVAYWPMSDQDVSLIDLGPGKQHAKLFGNPTWMANAGPPIISGDGVGMAARFKGPQGITVNGGMLYVADSVEHTIRKINPETRLVTTYAGVRDSAGTTNGFGTTAKFSAPVGLETHSNYILVTSNDNRIRRIDLGTTEVTTFAGAVTAGADDGAAESARFNQPRGMAIANNMLYVADCGNHTVRKVGLSDGVVDTLAGQAGVAGNVDGVDAAARFHAPYGIGVDDEGSLFVVEYDGRIVRKLSLIGTDEWKATTVGGLYKTSGYVDGLGTAARFSTMTMMEKDGAHGFYFADFANHRIRKISLRPWVNLANTPDILTNARNVNIAVRGGGITAYKFKMDTEENWRAELPGGSNIVLENLGEGDHSLTVIAKGAVNDWQPEDAPTTFAWTIDLTAPHAELFDTPELSTVDDMTDIQVGGDDVIKYKYKLQKMVNAAYPAAPYSSEYAVATSLVLNNLEPGTYTLSVVGRDTAGNWQTDADATTHEWFVQPVYVTTMCGSPAGKGDVNGRWFEAKFRWIRALAIASDGTLYIAEYGTCRSAIRKMDPDGIVTTLAGPMDNTKGFRDGPAEEALFNSPIDLVLSSDEKNLYVADYGNHVIRKVDTVTGETSTFAGTPGQAGYVNGPGHQAKFYYPYGVTIWEDSMYVINHSTHLIQRVDLETAAVSTLAGANAAGFVDADGSAARFYNPARAKVDDDGIMYLADVTNQAVRKIDLSTGEVKTLAGIGLAGTIDGPSTDAMFYNPYNVEIGDEYIYVADYTNHSIRRVNKETGEVGVLVGSKVRAAGYTDGVGNKALLHYPYALCKDQDGNLYTQTRCQQRVRKITFSPWVALFNTPMPRTNVKAVEITVQGGGMTGYKYKLDKPGTSGSSYSPDALGMNVPIARSDVGAEGRYTLSVIGRGAVGEWQSEAKASVYSWIVDLTPPKAELVNAPSDPYWGASAFITVISGKNTNDEDDPIVQYKFAHIRPTGEDPATTTYDIREPIQLRNLEPGIHTVKVMGCDAAGNWQVPEMDSPYKATVHTFEVKPLYVSIEAGEGTAGGGDGKWYEAQFTDPRDLCVDLSGNLVIADGSTKMVRRLEFKTGMVKTLYQGAAPAVAIDRNADGTLFIGAGKTGATVDIIASSGAHVKTVTGFSGPFGLTYDMYGGRNQLYVFESGLKRLQRVTPGSWNTDPKTLQSVVSPRGITVSSTTGQLLTAGFESHYIFWIDPTNGLCSYIAGRDKFSGSVDSIATAARFMLPSDAVMTDDDTIYVTDSGNHAIRRVTADGLVTTYAGIRGVTDALPEGTADRVSLNNPFAIVAHDGDLFVADTGSRNIKRISRYPHAMLRNTPPIATKRETATITVCGGGVASYGFVLTRIGSGTIIDNSAAAIAVSTPIELLAKSSVDDPNPDHHLINNPPGTYTLEVWGYGASGDRQATATVFEWLVDYNIVEPIAELQNTPASWTHGITTDIIATGASVVSYVYRLDGGSWSNVANSSTPIVLQDLSPATHTLEVKGIDRFGNRQDNTTNHVWYVAPTYVTTVAGSLPGYVNDKWYESKLYEPMGLAMNGDDELIFIDRVSRAVRKMRLDTGILSTIVDSSWAVLRFDGLEDHINLGNRETFKVDTQTIEMWIRPAAWDYTGYRGLIRHYCAGGGRLLLYSDGRVLYTYGSDAGNGSWWIGTGGIYPDAWSHLALVRDLDSFPMQVRFYLNGNLQSTTNVSYAPVRYSGYTREWLIGYRCGVQRFNGEMADLRFWNTARTQAEIQDNMRKLMTGTEDGLIGYWPLFDGSGATVRDMTVNKNHGTIIGSPEWSDAEPPFSVQGGNGGSNLNMGTPFGLAVATGSAYFVDYQRHVIYKTDLETSMTVVFAGAENQDGHVDGTGGAARFRIPTALTFDGSDLYVTDYGNHAIRKVTFAGVVTTIAGRSGSPGTVDGIGEAARFSYPMNLSADRHGLLYIADSGNATVRKMVIQSKDVTTLAGKAGQLGRVDGASMTARFSVPTGILALDPAAEHGYRVLVTDQDGHTIRAVSENGDVITVAGRYGVSGNDDGNGHTANFNQPFFMTHGGHGHVYLSDRLNNLIRKISFQPRVALKNTPPLLTGKDVDILVVGGGIGKYKYRLDGGEWSPNAIETSARINRSDMTDGLHVLEVVGLGIADYWDKTNLPQEHWQENAAAEKFTWEVDTTPPIVELDNLPSNPTQDRMASIIATGVDVIKYQYSLDGSAYSEPTHPASPIRLENLSYGQHRLLVKGVDIAGNWQQDPTIYEWVVKPLYVSLVAGEPGASSLTNGKWYNAHFMEPSGLVQADNSNVYVIGGGNQTLRNFRAAAMTVSNFWTDNNLGTMPPEESLEFDGNDDYVSIPHQAVFNTPSVTVEFWFTLGYDPDVDGNNNWRSMIRKGSTFGTTTGWDVVLEDNRTVSWDVGAAGVTSRLLKVDVGMTVGNPLHLAFVYDATTGNQFVYADGILASSTVRTAANIGFNTEPINIARGTNPGQFPNTNGFTPGRFANVRIWNVARTQEQISANMGRQLLGNESGLVGYWPLTIISGLITKDVWTGITGGAISDLTGKPAYPGQPNSRSEISAIDVPQSAPAIDYFGTRIYGWINPPQTGLYTFFLCSDDAGQLWLSTDGTPANKRKICGDTAAWGYKSWFANALQKSQLINLIAGRPYFIEVLQKENTGSDYVAAAWLRPGQTGTPEIIQGSALSTYAFRDVTDNQNHGELKDGPKWINAIENRRFDTHGDVVWEGNYLYVAARDTHTIRKVDLQTGNVMVLAGEPNEAGYANGNSAEARFNMPTGLVKKGSWLYVTDFGNQAIRRVDYATGDTEHVAGSKTGARGHVDSSSGSDSRFSGPFGITCDGNVLYITDAHNHVIRRMTEDGSTTTYAGQANVIGHNDGLINGEASFFSPTGIVYYNGYLYLANEGNHTVRRIDMSRDIVATVAGKGDTAGNTEGIGVNATFNAPHYITPVNGEPEAFFVTDNHTIRKIAPYPVATLKNLPDDPTNNTSISLSVYGGGVDVYKYKIQRGSTVLEPWSASWLAKNQPISLTTEMAGQYTVTVRGKNSTYGDEQPEEHATVFTWSKSANLALGKGAQQSSDLEAPKGVAGKAVDGETDGVYANGSVTCTKNDAQAWWQVDLESICYISKVRLWNSDNVPNRLANLYVLVSDTPFNTTNLWQTISQAGVDSYYFAGVVGRPTEIDINRTGRHVRVQLVGTNYLSLAEVEVMEGVAKNITAFRFDGLSPQVNGIIDDKAQTISLVVPPATKLVGLVPTILHSGESVAPGSGVPQDFTTSKTYLVTGEDETTRSYTVSVSKDIIRNGLILDLDAESSASYPGTGMTWYDRSRNGGDMTISGATFVPNRPMHFHFTDNAGNKIYNSSFQAFADVMDVTVSVWVRFDSLAINQGVISYAVPGGCNEFLFWFVPSTTIQPHWSEKNAGKAHPGLTVNKWHNIAFSRSGSEQLFYLDGAYVGNLGPQGTILRGGGYLVFGQEQDAVGGGFDNNQDFLGDMATVQIYKRVLSADEIISNYNALKPRFETSINAKTITEFNFFSPPATGVIDEDSKKISVVVPSSTNVTALTPSIWHTGLGISPKTGMVQDFSCPMIYTVTAADGTTAPYVVTVEKEIVKEGMILYLDADNPLSYPGSGNNWLDLSGHGHHGVLLNGVGYNAVDGSLVFDGTNDSVAVNASAFNFVGKQQYTALAWINPRGGGTTWHGVFSKGNTQQWALTLNSPSLYLQYETSQGGVGALNADPGGITTDVWQFIGVGFNGSNKSIFVDGSVIKTQVATALNSSANAEELRIGLANNGEYFRGNIAAVQVYNRTLSLAEIQHNHTVHKARHKIGTKSITSFSFGGLYPVVNGLVNESNNTITLAVPNEVSLTSLVPTISHNGVSVSPGSGVAQDFTNPVTYTVTGTDDTTAVYTARVERCYYDEGNNAGAFTANWNVSTVYNMIQFGGLGNVTAHGYSPLSNYTLTLAGLPAHTQIRYRVFWHMIDSLDSETSNLFTTNTDGSEVERARFTKGHSAVPAFTILAPGTTYMWSGHKDYTYRPWGQGSKGNDGYAIIDTGYYDHTGSTFSARHCIGADQAQTDEAMYLSHVQVWIR